LGKDQNDLGNAHPVLGSGTASTPVAEPPPAPVPAAPKGLPQPRPIAAPPNDPFLLPSVLPLARHLPSSAARTPGSVYPTNNTTTRESRSDRLNLRHDFLGRLQTGVDRASVTRLDLVQPANR
jgi:hypothetical protein